MTRRRRPRGQADDGRSQFLWGVGAVVLVAVLLVAATILYRFPPDRQRVLVDFSEAGQIRVSDGVRVAGIPVGRVTKITLAGDHAIVELSIRSSVHVGVDTSAEVRLLTIVGGHYVSLSPAGAARLGGHHIPVERTTLPYSLIDTFQLASPKLSQLDATPLRETLVQVQQGFGNNPGALAGDLKILDSMLKNLTTRQGDFGKLLQLATEYSGELNANGDVITSLARQLSSFLTEYSTFADRLTVAVGSLASLLERVRSVALVYDGHVDSLVREVDDIGRRLGPALSRFAPAIEQGRDLIQRLEKLVNPDGTVAVGGGASEILSSNVCIPMVGVKC